MDETWRIVVFSASVPVHVRGSTTHIEKVYFSVPIWGLCYHPTERNTEKIYLLILLCISVGRVVALCHHHSHPQSGLSPVQKSIPSQCGWLIRTSRYITLYNNYLSRCFYRLSCRKVYLLDVGGCTVMYRLRGCLYAIAT